MRIRTIKPDFWVSESVGRLSREARLLFIGLWSFADDSGRGRGALPPIAGALFPFDRDAPDRIGAWMAELDREGMIRRYVAEDGNTYYEIPKWLKHQKIDKPSQSRFPAPSSNSPRALAEPSAPVPRKQDLGIGNLEKEPLKEAGGGENARARPVEVDGTDGKADPPPTFPRTLAEAKAGAALWGATESVSERAWNLAASCGWRDARNVPIRSWPHYVAHCQAREREREREASTPAARRPAAPCRRREAESRQIQEDIEMPIFFKPPPYVPSAP